MRRELSPRHRALLGVALTAYEKLGNSTKANLEKLNLPVMAVDTAIGNAEVIRTRLGSSEKEVEFPGDLRITARDAVTLLYAKTQKVKEGQEDLLIPTEETEETQVEVSRLYAMFADQRELPLDDTTVEIRAGGETTGKMPLGEFHRRSAHIIAGATAE